MELGQINKSGIHYLITGARLITQPGIRLFVILPLLTNIILFASSFIWLINRLDELSNTLLQALPAWLDWLNYLLWPLAILTILLLFFFIFGLIANWIAAPFNGLLAEQVEAKLTGKTAPDASLATLLRDMPRIFRREWQKIKYYLPKALGCLILFFIPVLGQTLAPLLWFLFSAWMAAIQYCDYPFDNHKVAFADMRQALAQRRIHNLSFGTGVTLCTMVPVLNFLIMPIAVCGATAMWVDNYRPRFVPA